MDTGARQHLPCRCHLSTMHGTADSSSNWQLFCSSWHTLGCKARGLTRGHLEWHGAPMKYWHRRVRTSNALIRRRATRCSALVPPLLTRPGGGGRVPLFISDVAKNNRRRGATSRQLKGGHAWVNSDNASQPQHLCSNAIINYGYWCGAERFIPMHATALSGCLRARVCTRASVWLFHVLACNYSSLGARRPLNTYREQDRRVLKRVIICALTHLPWELFNTHLFWQRLFCSTVASGKC